MTKTLSYKILVTDGGWRSTMFITREEIDFLQGKEQQKCEDCGHLCLFHTSRTDCQICGVGKCPASDAILE